MTPISPQARREATACTCGVACPLWATIVDGKLVKVEPREPGRICHRGLVWPQRVYAPERLLYPMKRAGERGQGKWERITWDEALDTTVARLKEVREKYGPRAVAFSRLGTRDPYLGLLADLFGGTMVFVQGVVSDSGVGYGRITGMASRTVAKPGELTNFAPGGHSFQDIANSKLIIVWGRNPAWTWPSLMRHLLDAWEAGARLIVVDPLCTATASKADTWIPVRPGTDAALIMSMIGVINDEELGDLEFMRKYTNSPFLAHRDSGRLLREADVRAGGSPDRFMVLDERSGSVRPADEPGVIPALLGHFTFGGQEYTPVYQLLMDEAHQYPPEKAADITGVPAESIRQLAREYATVKPASIWAGWGLGRYYHSDITQRCLLTLAALTGNIGIPGGGVSTAPQVRTFPLNPQALPVPPTKAQMLDGLSFCQAAAGEEVAALGGQRYPIKALVSGASGLLSAYPDTRKIANEILGNIEFFVTTDIVMSDTAKYADIVLPAASPFERTNLYTPTLPSEPGEIHLLPKVIEPLGECRSEHDIFAELGRRLGWEEYFRLSEEALVERLLASAPGGISLEQLRQGQTPQKDSSPESHPHVMFADKRFPTTSGRLECYAEELAPLGEALPSYLPRPIERYGRPEKRYPLTFLTAHGLFDGARYATVPFYREIEPEPILQINPRDAQERGIADGQMVRVYNDRGEVKLKVRLNSALKQGVVRATRGWRRDQYPAGHHADLIASDINPSHLLQAKLPTGEPNSAMFDVWVEVEAA